MRKTSGTKKRTYSYKNKIENFEIQKWEKNNSLDTSSIIDRKDDQLVQDWSPDVNFDQQETLIYEHIDKQLEPELFPANYKIKDIAMK